MLKYYKMAEKLALEHEYDDVLEYQLCAIIVKGGSVVSVGYNKRATNAFVEHYADIARGAGRDYCMSTHAEMEAVLKARGKIDLRGSKIYVVRIRAAGGLGMAKPCEICRYVLFNYGIKKAYYSISSNEFGTMKVVNPAKDYQ